MTPGRHLWPPNYIQQLSSGEISGQFEEALDTLARERKEALVTRVQYVRKIVEPAVAYVVALAIAWEIANFQTRTYCALR